MATRKNTRRTSSKKAQNTRRGSNAMNIQREINSDYKGLARDYKKLLVELWRKPASKYILGGAAITVLAPVLMRALRRIPQVDSFIHENVNLGEISSNIKERVASFRNAAEDVAEM